MDKKRINSILHASSKLSNLNRGEQEGERLINVSPKSKTELGKALSPLTPTSTKLFCGEVGCIKTFMQAIKNKNFPLEFLPKRRINYSELAKIPKSKSMVPNYWALVAYAVVERIKQDKKTAEMLKMNTLELTCLGEPRDAEFFGSIIKISNVNIKMALYISILRNIEIMLKEDRFYKKEEIDKFIIACKDDPDADILEGICLPIERVEKTDKENTETK